MVEIKIIFYLVVHVNARSLKRRYYYLESIVYSVDTLPDIACITETWLTEAADAKNLFKTIYPYFLIQKRKTASSDVMI